jgi:hypothetical protein
MRLIRTVVPALLITCGVPIGASADEPEHTARTRVHRLPMFDAPMQRPVAPRAFRSLFAGAIGAVLPVPVTDDMCQGWYFPPCDPNTECSVDAYQCEVGERSGVAEPTWLMRCAACGSGGDE